MTDIGHYAPVYFITLVTQIQVAVWVSNLDSGSSVQHIYLISK